MNAQRRALVLIIVIVLLTLAACGDDDASMADGGRDGGSRDGSVVDATVRIDGGGGSDAGSDPCAATEDNAGSTVGCNGAPSGPAADNAFGGACDVTEVDEGSCTDTGAYCDEWQGDDRGQCLIPCTPTSPTYISTGGCPTGSRCFDFGDGDSWCYADCAAHTDCPSGLCADDGSCLDPDPCAADEAGAAATVGCNGAAVGPQAANALGGTCTPDADGGPGTCTDVLSFCNDIDGDGTGQCAVDCYSTGATYVSDGQCPDGFRCFDVALDGDSYCYADCSAPAECASMACGTTMSCGS